MDEIMDVVKFLSMFDKKELYRRKVFNNLNYMLNSKSPIELANLMKEKGVKKLIYKDGWFFDIEFDYRNPNAKNRIYRVGVHNLRKIKDGFGTVFEGQNININPHYRPGKGVNNITSRIEI